MRHLKVTELLAAGLPASLPENTELGVWKRSTGYEVFLPYRRSPMYWIFLAVGYVCLIAASLLAIQVYPITENAIRNVVYVVSGGFVLTYTGYLLFKYYEVRNTRIRIDMTATNMLVTLVHPSLSMTKIVDIPVSKIEEVMIDGLRGFAVNGSKRDPSFGLWIGAGLKITDLYYLALLIGHVTKLPPFNPGRTGSDVLSQL